jgi:hypothetical protein
VRRRAPLTALIAGTGPLLNLLGRGFSGRVGRGVETQQRNQQVQVDGEHQPRCRGLKLANANGGLINVLLSYIP